MKGMACRYCKGKGVRGPVHVNYGDGHGEWRDLISCGECDGTGKWDEARAIRWHKGQAIKKHREESRMAIFAFARAHDISPSELSGIERGKRPETEEGRALTMRFKGL